MTTSRTWRLCSRETKRTIDRRPPNDASSEFGGQGIPPTTFQRGDQVVTASVFVPRQAASPDTFETFVTVDRDATLALNGSVLSAN